MLLLNEYAEYLLAWSVLSRIFEMKTIYFFIGEEFLSCSLAVIVLKYFEISKYYWNILTSIFVNINIMYPENAYSAQ